MKFISLEPFVPSGDDFEKAKQLFLELGFNLNWENGGYAGFEKDGCKFILQHYQNRDFAENFMLSVRLSDAEGFYREIKEKNLDQRFGIRVAAPVLQPYGKEVNLIDLAGVCWHFVE